MTVVLHSSWHECGTELELGTAHELTWQSGKLMAGRVPYSTFQCLRGRNRVFRGARWWALGNSDQRVSGGDPVLKAATGELVLVRFSPMNQDRFVRQATDDADYRESLGEERIWAISAYGDCLGEGETVEALVSR